MSADALRIDRVANPPPVFVGRAEERRRLDALVERGPLAVVWGPGGIGKSALVQSALVGRADDAKAHFVRKNDNFEQLGLDLLHLLAGPRAPRARSRDRAALAAEVLDAAERLEALVVVEDIHHVEDAERWLELFSSYARASTWIATSRVAPSSPRLQDHLLEVRPLEERAARELATRCHASPSELAEIVEAAGGSPFWIRQLTSRRAVAHRPTRRDVLEGLSDEAVRYLAMLAVLHEPLLLHLPGEAAIRAELARHDLLVGAGRLHDAAADSVLARLSHEQTREAEHEAAGALSSSTDARAQLEAFRLCLSDSNFDGARELLQQHERWIASGLGPRLWELLERAGDPSLHASKIAAALHVGSGRSLQWLVEQSRPDAFEDRMHWLSGMIRIGLLQRAARILEGEDQSATNVRLMLGEALCGAGEAKRSVRILEAIVPASPLEHVKRDLRLTRSLLHADDSRRAARLLEGIHGKLRSLPSDERSVFASELDELRLELGLSNDGSKLPRGAKLGMRGIIIQGIQLAAAGRYRKSTELLEQLLASVDMPASHSLLAKVGQGILRVTRGHYDGLSAMALEMILEAERLGNASLYHYAFLLERLANLGEAASRPEVAWSSRIPMPTGVPARYLGALRAAHAARRGEPVGEEAMPRAMPDDGPLVACVCDLAEASVRLVGGDAERASFLAAQAIRQSVRLRYSFVRGEALLIQAYAQLSLGRRVELSQTLDELRGVARLFRSTRYARIADLLSSAFVHRPPFDTLRALASGSSASPTVVRVARELLGGPPCTDALDRVIASGIRRMWQVEVLPSGHGTTPRWFVVEDERVVELPGRTVSLSPLSLRILVCLLDAGGELALGDIASAAWDIAEYHALRDAKRVHVAVRRLRTQLEDDPSEPSRLITVAGGYALSRQDPPGRVVTRVSS